MIMVKALFLMCAVVLLALFIFFSIKEDDK